jgi:hypothetical protein
MIKANFFSWFQLGTDNNQPVNYVKIAEGQSLIRAMCFVGREVWCGEGGKISIWDSVVNYQKFNLMVPETYPEKGNNESTQLVHLRHESCKKSRIYNCVDSFMGGSYKNLGCKGI